MVRRPIAIIVSQKCLAERCNSVDARNEAVIEINGEMNSNNAQLDLEAIFEAQYERIARVIARVIRDPGRAEELAVEVFLKWSRSPLARDSKAQGSKAEISKSEAWLYRTAARLALDELRKQVRRKRYDGLSAWVRKPPTPEELHAAAEEQNKVRAVLGALAPRQAELLLLRSQGLNYDELASTLDLNPASVGTLLSRAQQAFRKEYVEKYGEE
jgi:RNA polymerase sigma-70 factor (ECF subfamily)